MPALRIRSACCTNPTISVRWVVASTMAPAVRNSSRTAEPMAAPCSGSVPVPSSSSRTKVAGAAWERMAAVAATWAEKVESCCSIDWSSPISTRSPCRSGIRVDGSAGIGIPLSAITDRSPTVLRAMVLPPALGPLMVTTCGVSSPVAGQPSIRSSGTTCRASSDRSHRAKSSG